MGAASILPGADSPARRSGFNRRQSPGVTRSLDIPGLTPRLALGFRRLRTDYAGPCVRLRCGSVETDIGFAEDGEELDLDAIAAFARSQGVPWTGIRLCRWYDQSGLGLDAAQANPGNMPLLGVYRHPLFGLRAGLLNSWGANPYGTGAAQWLQGPPGFNASIRCGLVVAGQNDARTPTPYQHRAFVMGSVDSATQWRVGCPASGAPVPNDWAVTIGPRFPVSSAPSVVGPTGRPFVVSYRTQGPALQVITWGADEATDTRITNVPTWTADTYWIGRRGSGDDAGNWIGWLFEVSVTDEPSADLLRALVRDAIGAHTNPANLPIAPLPFV
jgi:hypothetical protein